MSDINLSTLPDPMVEHLICGPSLFQRHNLLALVPPGAPTHYHSGMQLILGRTGSYTDVHTDWYGTDGYLELLEGRKAWYLAPPEKQHLFRDIFEDKNVNVTKFSAALTSQLAEMNCHVIIQEAGDVVFVPGGWVHCVKNLTDTVAIGGSYLRAWKLPFLVQYLRMTSRKSADSILDWRGVFQLLEKSTNLEALGITEVERKDYLRLHEAHRSMYGKKITAETIVGMQDINSILQQASSLTEQEQQVLAAMLVHRNRQQVEIDADKRKRKIEKKALGDKHDREIHQVMQAQNMRLAEERRNLTVGGRESRHREDDTDEDERSRERSRPKVSAAAAPSTASPASSHASSTNDATKL